MINNKKDLFNSRRISIWIISYFPVAIILGPLIAETFLLLLNVLFFFNFKTKIFFKDKNLLLFLVIWVYLILNIFLSNNANNEFLRQISYIRFIIFAFAICEFIKNKEDFNQIFKIWLITFIITFADLIYEKINGVNFFGFQSPNKLRLVGFLKDELKIAYIITGFCFLIAGHLFNIKKTGYIAIIFLLLTVTIIFITGERSNFLKSIIFLFLFTFFVFNKDLKKVFFINLLTLALIVSLFNLIKTSNSLYSQFYERLLFKDDDNKINVYKNLLELSPHPAHFIASVKIANDYPFFGAGIKNFRSICSDKKYETKKYNSAQICSTHPHQVYLEVISEAGYLGLIFFILPFFIFIIRNIKIFLINQNYIHLSGILILIIHFLPLLPSGSIFTNNAGLILWLNIGFVLASSNFKNNSTN